MINLNVGVSLNLSALRKLLDANPDAPLHFVLPDGTRVPPEFHVTEVGKVRKDFIDCGGTVRSTERCVLQVWVDAGDEAHRLIPSKLSRIIAMAMPLLGSDELLMEVEYDMGVITQFPISGAEMTAEGLELRLEGKHTACLAPDRCGVGIGGGAKKCC